MIFFKCFLENPITSLQVLCKTSFYFKKFLRLVVCKTSFYLFILQFLSANRIILPVRCSYRCKLARRSLKLDCHSLAQVLTVLPKGSWGTWVSDWDCTYKQNVI